MVWGNKPALRRSARLADSPRLVYSESWKSPAEKPEGGKRGVRIWEEKQGAIGRAKHTPVTPLPPNLNVHASPEALDTSTASSGGMSDGSVSARKSDLWRRERLIRRRNARRSVAQRSRAAQPKETQQAPDTGTQGGRGR